MPYTTPNSSLDTQNNKGSRLSPAWRLNLAEAYFADGQAARAMELLEYTPWRDIADINQRAE